MLLEKGHIRLRQLTLEDTKDLAALANNKKIWDNVRDYFPFPYTEKDAEKFINSVNSNLLPLNFAIEFNNEFAGVISLVPMDDVYRKSAEIGYWIGEPFWNKGIGEVAVNLITDYGLHQLNFSRIHAGIFEYNKASMRVLEKCGYKKEGVFKRSIFKNDQLWDEHRYAKTK